MIRIRVVTVAAVLVLSGSACDTGRTSAPSTSSTSITSAATPAPSTSASTLPATTASATTTPATTPATIATTLAKPATTPVPTTAIPATTIKVANPCAGIDFRNMAYDLPESGQVTVVDGQGTRGTASSLDYAALQVRAVVAGDFGGVDAAPETAVFTNTNTGGTGQFSDVHVFTCSASTTQLVASAGVGDRADDGVRAIALANGKLIIDRFADAQGACCPTAAIRQGYRLSGSTLTPSGPAEKRKIISLDIVGTADAIITFLPGTNGAVLFGDTSTAHAGGFDASAGQKLTLAIEASPPGTAAAIIDITTGGTVLASATSGGAVTVTLPATGHYLLKPHAGAGGEDAAFDAEMTIV